VSTPQLHPIATDLPQRRRAFLNPLVVRENLAGYAFIFPAMVIIGLFGLFPILYAGYMSIHNWTASQGRSYCQAGVEGIQTLDGVGGAAWVWQSASALISNCLTNYNEIIGDWSGALFFVLGCGLLLLAYWLWNHAFENFHEYKLVYQLGVAFAVVGLGLFTIAYGWAKLSARGDEDFLQGLVYTFYYAFGSVPLQLGLGLTLAYLLFQNIRGKQFYRTILFIPYITPAVASAVVFRIVFSSRDSSLANQFLTFFGGDSQGWIAESQPFWNALFGWNLQGFWAGPSMALVTVILLGVWTYTGYNAVIFLAGLGAIPIDLYEAARVDGASEWHLFRYITLPMISPVTFYLSVLAFIGTFKAFNSIYVMRDAYSQGTTDAAAIVIFDTFYKANQFGYAAAQAIVLFLIIFALTQIQRTVFESRVFYG
jgi:multiple sugar transport system permease protein